MTEIFQKFSMISENIQKINFPLETFDEHESNILTNIKISSNQIDS